MNGRIRREYRLNLIRTVVGGIRAATPPELADAEIDRALAWLSGFDRLAEGDALAAQIDQLQERIAMLEDERKDGSRESTESGSSANSEDTSC